MKTINGKPISEEQIDTWVAEAEEGYDVEMLRKRGRKPRDGEAAQVVSIRLSPSEVFHLDQYAATHGLSRSQAIRKALKKRHLRSRSAVALKSTVSNRNPRSLQPLRDVYTKRHSTRIARSVNLGSDLIPLCGGWRLSFFSGMTALKPSSTQ